MPKLLSKEKTVPAGLFQRFGAGMPSNAAVIEQGIELALTKYGPTASRIKANFSVLLKEAHDQVYGIYRQAEHQQGERILGEFVRDRESGALFEELNRFFVSLTQSRRSRAGEAFQEIVKVLFKRLEYPFDENKVINGKPDFVMPSEAHFKKDAVDCMVFAIKRTLRERWRQIVAEGAKAARFFLATIDEKLTRQMLKDAHERKIYIVVPSVTKSGIEHYRTAPNVISFEDFFEDHLDPAVVRWRRKKIIP